MKHFQAGDRVVCTRLGLGTVAAPTYRRRNGVHYTPVRWDETANDEFGNETPVSDASEFSISAAS